MGKGDCSMKAKRIYCKDGLVKISIIKIKKIQDLGDMRKFEVGQLGIETSEDKA